jgi:hypothetical protein
MSFLKRTIASTAALTLVLLAPITFQPASVLAEGPGALIRLNDACGQATSCRAASTYICSTHNQDHMNYTCNTGCAPPQET